MPPLAPGANAPLPPARTFALRLSTERAHADLIVLCVRGDGTADGDDGVALWSQPQAAGGAVRIDTATDTVTLDTGGLPGDVARLLVVAQADGVPDMAGCGRVGAQVTADGAPAGELEIPAPPAMATVQVGEVYRHSSGWKVRCLGDGYGEGLRRLLEVHGIEVDDEPAEAASAPPPPSQAPTPSGGISLTKGEEKLPVDMRKRLSLRKQAVQVTLEKKGISGVRARVVLVMDASGSMSKLYRGGTMAAVVERVMAVAAQLDDDGEMEAWTFASACAKLPSLQLGDMPAWIASNVRLGGRIGGPAAREPGSGGGLFRRRKGADGAPGGGPAETIDWDGLGYGNNEQLVIADITRWVAENPVPDPTFVLFFSDGGVYNNDEIEHELRAAVRSPIFWQFIGLGSSAGYGVLEYFDTLPGREVDNVGFFAVDDIDRIADADLYDRLLSEFPQWLTAGKVAGVLR